jgi:signal transduction histidine kinase/CheY-like chemotaxis protein
MDVELFFPGESELVGRLRVLDWSNTSVGPPEGWPQNLRTALSICLTAPCPMHIWWGRDLTLFYNDAYSRWLGPGQHPYVLARSGREPWADTIRPLVDNVFETGRATFSEDIPMSVDGDRVSVRLSFSPVLGEGGTVDGVLCVCAETADGQDASRRAFLDALQDAPAAIAVFCGPDHVFEFANRAYTDMVGKRPILGRPIRQALPEFESPDNRAILQSLDAAYASGEAMTLQSLPVTLACGSRGTPEECVFQVLLQPLRGRCGAIDRVVLVAVDVTELTNARRRADIASRTKDEFLAMLGHELRNPLAPILTGLQLMRLKKVTGADRELSSIERQVKHLVSLVDDLLDVSRVTRGTIQLHKSRIHLGDAVARALEIASPLLEERRHHLEIEVPRTDAFELDADIDRVAQVLANLLTNAAKYTDPGGRICVTASRTDADIVVRVRDTGIGISPGMLPRVFDCFAQESQGKDRSQGGLGLGLAIVKSLVELHSGHVRAWSDGVGSGAEFEVCLPAPSSGEAAIKVGGIRRRATASNGNRRRILVVDDNEDAADLLGESLTLHGHEIRLVADGPSALAVAKDFRPEIALLDIGLPGMDGYELGMRLRDLPGLADVRLIAVTGYGQESDRRRSAEAGFDCHLVKPVDVERLPADLEAVWKAHSRGVLRSSESNAGQ